MRIKALAAAFLLIATDVALADPPGRVGRLSFSEGTVWHRGAEQEPWSPAPLNLPITSGASVRTDDAARTEIQIGAVELRLDRNTTLDIPRLDDDATRFRITEGVVSIRVRALPEGGLLAESAHGEISVLQPGRYRIESRPATPEQPGGFAELAVFEGRVRLVGPETTLDIAAGQKATLAGEPVRIETGVATMLPVDRWAQDRERTVSPVAGQYVSPETTGWQDLGAYGEWRTVPAYGSVWCPSNVPADWAPYRHGRWAFIEPWGWTWIDEAPWGFAPFHYGRWVFVDHRWAWWPGRTVVRPVYAPALVVFVGRVRHGHVDRHRPHGVAWVPLGPHEAYHPHYRATPRYHRRINAGVADRDRHDAADDRKKDRPVAIGALANRRAATAISREAFVRSVPVHRTGRSSGAAQFADAVAARDIDDLRPTRHPNPAIPASVTKPRAVKPSGALPSVVKPSVAKPSVAKPVPPAQHRVPDRRQDPPRAEIRDERKPATNAGSISAQPGDRSHDSAGERGRPRAAEPPRDRPAPVRSNQAKRPDRSPGVAHPGDGRGPFPSAPRHAAPPVAPRVAAPSAIESPGRGGKERDRGNVFRSQPPQVHVPHRPRASDARPAERRQAQPKPVPKPQAAAPQRTRDASRTGDAGRGGRRP